MIFLGLLFQKENENSIRQKSSGYYAQNHANLFQWNLIDGLFENGETVDIINCLPVGVFPKQYKELVIKTEKWDYHGRINTQIGSVNLPAFKQLIREKRIKKQLRDVRNEKIVLYSPYLPFLKAINKLDKSCHITLIVTDLPEYSDLERASGIRNFLRRRYNKLVYRYMNRVDSFVLLTEQMKLPIHVDGRPYTVIEGVHSSSVPSVSLTDNYGKKIVFYSGSLHYIYGIKTLLDAFLRIDDEDMELWICGKGEAEKDINQAVKLDGRIRFFGFRSISEVAELRSHANILVNPRPDEGEYTKYSFPSKTMEYLASGIPLIAHKLSGIPDEYDEYINSLSDNGIDTMKDTIVEICEDKTGRYKENAHKAVDFIRQDKNPAAQAKKLLDMLNSIKSI